MGYQVFVRPFDPVRAGSTVNLAVLATTANVQVNPTTVGHREIRIANIGTNVVFINFGKDSTVQASLTTSIPMLPNAVEKFYLHNDESWVAAIAGSTGNTIYITEGE